MRYPVLFSALVALSGATMMLGTQACSSTGETIGSLGGGGGFNPKSGNDCNGGPDFEGCPCNIGDQKACYSGPAGTKDVGGCHAGANVCVPTGELKSTFGPCEGEIVPDQDHSCTTTGAGGGGAGGNGAGGGPVNNCKPFPTTMHWVPMSTQGAPFPRTNFPSTPIWTGTELIIWGGMDYFDIGRNDGARYVPATDTWKPISAVNAPSKRFGAAAVWTGKVMIVWGGVDQAIQPAKTLGDGGIYDPATDAWTAIPDAGALGPTPRGGAMTAWTGAEMVVWGGGERDAWFYNPTTGKWRAFKMLAPQSTSWGVWASDTAFLFGSGWPGSDDRYAYSDATQAWTALPASPLQPARGAFAAVAASGLMFVGGGNYSVNQVEHYFADAALYNPKTGMWKSTSPAPHMFYLNRTVSTECGDILIVGGADDMGPTLKGGLRYNIATDSWFTLPDEPGQSGIYRNNPTVAWAGDQLIAWGGFNDPQIPGDTFFAYRLIP
jgi:hypothetical protein